MAYSNRPIFVAVPRSAAVSIATANTNRDGTGTLGSLLVGGAQGTRVDKITITAIVTTSAGMIRFFLDDATNKRAIKEVPVTVVAPDADTPAFSYEWVRDDGLPLVFVPSGSTLKCSTHNAETFHVVAEGGDY